MNSAPYERVSTGDQRRPPTRRSPVLYLAAALLAIGAGSLTLALGGSRRSQAHHIRAARCKTRSPAYPSEGGPGCSPKCISEQGQQNSSSGAVFNVATNTWPESLVRNMHSAGAILRRFGTPVSLDAERNSGLHVTFQYFCCYSPQETNTIKALLKSYAWVERSITFDRMECAVHAPDSMTSLVLMADARSQKLLSDWALDFEREMAKVGVPKHIPHSLMQDFHMTLGVVNETTLPVNTAVDAINKEILPGTWNDVPISLHKPLFSA